MKRAKSEAEVVLQQANAQIENTIRQIKEAQAEKEKTRAVRQEFEAFKQSVAAQENVSDDKITRKIKQLQEREQRKKAKQKKKEKEIWKPEVIEPGDNVRIKGQNTVGEVVEIQGKNSIVIFGMLKSTVKTELLEKVSKNQVKKIQPKNTFVSEQTADDIRERKLNFKQEIDVRGMRGDEALQAVTYFIDDAILVGVSRVRILHGTGTGILRQLIRQYLKTVPGVAHFQDEHVQFGGAGITVVELA